MSIWLATAGELHYHFSGSYESGSKQVSRFGSRTWPDQIFFKIIIICNDLCMVDKFSKIYNNLCVIDRF